MKRFHLSSSAELLEFQLPRRTIQILLFRQ